VKALVVGLMVAWEFTLRELAGQRAESVKKALRCAMQRRLENFARFFGSRSGHFVG
jgi:hypothetical protein